MSDAERPLGYESPVTAHMLKPWSGLVRTVAVLGIATGIARLIYSWWYLPPLGRPFVDMVVHGGMGWREWFPMIVQGLLVALVGLGIIIAAIACLARKEWGSVVLLLNEQMSIVLYAFITLTSLTQIYLEDNALEQAAAVAAWELADLAFRIAYPVLAVALFRTRAVRAWFRAQAARSRAMEV